MSFQEWIETIHTHDEAAQRLLDLQRAEQIQWPEAGQGKQAFAAAIDTSRVSDEQKAARKEDLAKLWDKWSIRNETSSRDDNDNIGATDRLREFLQSFIDNIGRILGGAIAVAIVASIIIALFGGNQQFLEKLAHTEFARGLITFLFAIGTIGLAFVLALSVLTHGNEDEAKARFERGKEVLTIFIGILGTIIGFYFGSLTNPGEGIGTISLLPPQISNESPVSGQQVTLTTLVTGGSAPYKYSVMYETVDGNLIGSTEQTLFKNIEGASTNNGLIVWTIDIPQVEQDVKVVYRLLVIDSADHSVVSQGHQFSIKGKAGGEISSASVP